MSDDSEPEEPQPDGETVYVVEAIVSHMTFRDACKKFVYGDNGFNCETYNEFTHCKYVFQIKWMHWASASNTWEEERNAEDNQQLILYKKRHGLPSAVEYDTFYVQSFLTTAVKNGDPDLDETVIQYVRTNWITPFNTSVQDKRRVQQENKAKSKRRSSSTKVKDRAALRNSRSTSKDVDDGIARKKRRAGTITNMADVNKFISVEEKERIEKERREKVSREEEKRLAELDDLDNLENKLLKRKSRKSEATSANRNVVESGGKTEKKRTEAIKEKARVAAQQSFSFDPDVFDSDPHHGKEQPKSTQRPKMNEVKDTGRHKPSISSASKRPMERTNILSSAVQKSSFVKQRPSTSTDVSSREKNVENKRKTDKQRPSTSSHLPSREKSVEHKRTTEKRSSDDMSSNNKIPRLQNREGDENRKSLLDKHLNRKSVEKTSHRGVSVFYNIVQNYKELSRKCRSLEVDVLRRCQSAEQLNKRWAEPQDNYKKLDSWLTSVEKIRPITHVCKNKTIKCIHVDTIWNPEDCAWEEGENRRISKLLDYPGFPKPCKRPKPILLTTKRKAKDVPKANEKPLVITLDDDEEIDITSRNITGLPPLYKKIKILVPNDKLKETTDVLIEASKYYAALNPELFHSAVNKAPKDLKLHIVNEIMKHIQIEACKPVELRNINNLSSRMCQLFEADGCKKSEWLKVTKLCSPEHLKCRMLEEILFAMGEKGRYRKESIFSSVVLFYCMKHGAVCQKKKLIEWGYPFFEDVTFYPEQSDFYVDHSILMIRQFDANQLIELIVMGVDINQMAWTKTKKRSGLIMSQWQPVPVMEFFKNLKQQNLDCIAENTLKEMNLILGRISLQLSSFVQRRMNRIIETNFPSYAYHGFLTPAHIIRSVWPNDLANLMVYIDWEKVWNNYGDIEKEKCLPLDEKTVENLECEDSKLIITLFRVSIEGEIAADQSRRVTRNLKIGDLNDGECAPLSLCVQGLNNISHTVELKPMDGTLKRNEWIFELNGRDTYPFCRDSQLKISVRTSSAEVGTLFLFRLHVLNWKV